MISDYDNYLEMIDLKESSLWQDKSDRDDFYSWTTEQYICHKELSFCRFSFHANQLQDSDSDLLDLSW